jgi:hypothetical protein
VSMKVQRRYLTLLEAVLVCAVLAIIAVTLAVSLGARITHKTDLQGSCRPRLKQLGLAALMYSGDFGGYFPNVNPRGLV